MPPGFLALVSVAVLALDAGDQVLGQVTDIDDTTTTAVETTTVIDGNWGDWVAWTSCSAYCGTGTKYRSRSCDNPAPSGGKDCVGDSTGSTSCTAAAQCCAPKVFDVVFLIDRTLSYISYIKTFFKKVANIFEIAPSRTRISAATLSSTITLLFNFTTHSSNTTLTQAIDNIVSSYYSKTNSKDALDFARGTMFTTENGARSDVSDVIIMVISDVNTVGVDTAAQKLKDKGVYMMVAEEYLYYSSKLKTYADVYFTFYYAYSLDQTEINIISSGFPCNYFCGTSFFALDSPSTLSTGNDSSAGYLYLMTDSAFQVSCCGATSAWEFFAVNFGTVEIMVFRRISEHMYYLVGSTKVIVPEEYVNTVVSYSLTATERIAIVTGDTLGWYTNGPNIIGHADCTTTTRTDCPQSNKKLVQNAGVTFTAGQSIDFSSAETIPNRGYSIKIATTNNSALTLNPIQNETEIEENTPVGYKILYFGVTDPDLNDNITWELKGGHSNFIMSAMQYSYVTLNLQTKLPPGGGGPYIITVIGTDSCHHTASATVTISVYNAPPIINNLPYITELTEATKTSVYLYTINVTDATNDAVNCTMRYTLPVSYNFKFIEQSGVYSIWTFDDPAFAYNDINSYRIFICCQDTCGSTTSYLHLRITENKKTETYNPPDWFYRALIVSLMPIAIMTLFSCATLVITMFFLDDNIRIETKDQIKIIESSNSIEMNTEPPEETVDDFEVKAETTTIKFKNAFNDEVINIPIWRGKGRQQVAETPNQLRNLIDMFKNRNTSDDLINNGEKFGVELKLFNYDKKPKKAISTENRIAEIYQKKCEITDKWKQTFHMAEKKKILKGKIKKVITSAPSKESSAIMINDAQEEFSATAKNTINEKQTKEFSAHLVIGDQRNANIFIGDENIFDASFNIQNDEQRLFEEENTDKEEDRLSILQKVAVAGTAPPVTSLS